MAYMDLHMHTHYSDGRLSPEVVVKENAILGLDYIAITDHDTMYGYWEAKKAADIWGVKLVPGVEITTHKYHILGLNVDPNSSEFQEFLQYSQELQENIQNQRIKILQDKGVPISMEKVKAVFPHARIGRFNLAMTMMADPACRAYLNIPNSEIYDKTLGHNGLVTGVDESKQVSSKLAIEEIHRAGGIAVVAHPFKDTNDPKELEELIVEGLDGVEVQPHYNSRNIPYMEFARHHNLIITYGSDFHGPSKQDRQLLGRVADMYPEWERRVQLPDPEELEEIEQEFYEQY